MMARRPDQPVSAPPRFAFVSSIPVALLLPITLFLFGPCYLYYANAAEFSFPFANYFWWLMLLVSFGFLLIAGLLARFRSRPKAYQRLTALVFTLGLLAWFQGNVLVWDYGLLDGRDIDWTVHNRFAPFDALVWVAVLGLALWKTSGVCRIAASASVSLIVIQAISVATAIAQAPPTERHTTSPTIKNDIYRFSPDKNVIMLILDTFQSDIFQALIDNNRDHYSTFSGFTYFRNALGGYPTTYASIPLMLSGAYYENDVPLREHVKRSFLTDSLPKTLHDNAFQVDLLPLTFLALHCDDTLSSNCMESLRVVQKDDRKLVIDQAARLADVSLFRHAPHVLKPYLYNRQNWALSRLLRDLRFGSIREGHWLDEAFYAHFKQRAVVDAERPTFKLYHLFGLHPPFRLNADCSEHPVDETRDNALQRRMGLAQGECILSQVKAFLEHLKRLGVYDESMIIIAGDHGSSGSHHVGVDFQDDAPTIDGGFTPPVRLKASALPLLLIKPLRAEGEMTISNAPVSLCDLPNTIVDALEIDARFPCESAFALGDGAQRERRYLFYEWDDEVWQKTYLPNMREYLVSGYGWRDRAWAPTHRTFTSLGISINTPDRYELGSPLLFTAKGNAIAYLGKGWELPGEKSTWIDGKKAWLRLPIEKTNADLMIDAVIDPFLVEGKLDHQLVNVYVNRNPIGSWKVTSPGHYHLTIPGALIEGMDTLRILFELPKAVSPAKLGIDDDKKVLGVAIESMTVSPLN